MPRRIPDYPVVYQSLNTLCSLGSLISLAGVLVWFYVIYDALVDTKQECARNPWIFTPQIADLTRRMTQLSEYVRRTHAVLGNTTHIASVTPVFSSTGVKTSTLEWALRSPMNAHTFLVPPFFFTTGAHYTHFRAGACNIVYGVASRAATKWSAILSQLAVVDGRIDICIVSNFRAADTALLSHYARWYACAYTQYTNVRSVYKHKHV